MDCSFVLAAIPSDSPLSAARSNQGLGSAEDAMSDLEKLLEKTANKVLYNLATSLAYKPKGETNQQIQDSIDHDRVTVAMELRSELLPLLEAGQAMRDANGSNWPANSKAWDAALEKAKGHDSR